MKRFKNNDTTCIHNSIRITIDGTYETLCDAIIIQGTHNTLHTKIHCAKGYQFYVSNTCGDWTGIIPFFESKSYTYFKRIESDSCKQRDKHNSMVPHIEVERPMTALKKEHQAKILTLTIQLRDLKYRINKIKEFLTT